MVKTMVITNDIYLLDRLIGEFEKHKMKIHLVKISTSKEDTLKYLEFAEPDLVLFDETVRQDYDRNFFKTFNIRSATIRNNKNGLISKNTIDNIKALIKEVDVDMKREMVVNELVELGYKEKYKGTQYLADAVMQVYLHKERIINNFQKDIYPVLSKKYGKTILNIKSSINKATETMYYDGDIEKLEQYFQCESDMKPTTKNIVLTIANNIP